jgi:hypothetical protein
VLVNADEVDAPVVSDPLREGQRLVHGNTELVAAPPGGDVVVGAGVDVRVDAQGDAGALAEAGADAVEVIEFGARLDVEEQDALAQA